MIHEATTIQINDVVKLPDGSALARVERVSGDLVTVSEPRPLGGENRVKEVIQTFRASWLTVVIRAAELDEDMRPAVRPPTPRRDMSVTYYDANRESCKGRARQRYYRMRETLTVEKLESYRAAKRAKHHAKLASMTETERMAFRMAVRQRAKAWAERKKGDAA